MDKVIIKQMKNIDYKTQEAIRTLRTSLVNSREFENTAVFTSYMGKEGKSFVAWNTACAMAATGKKCLYINANLREKMSADIYEAEGLNNTLAAYLKGECKKAELVYATDKANLYIIEAGAPCAEATELLDTELYRALIKGLKEEYDYIIIDTPALGEVSDALVVGKEADGVVIVMEKGMVPYEQAQKMKKQLERNNCKVLGVVLNK